MVEGIFGSFRAFLTVELTPSAAIKISYSNGIFSLPILIIALLSLKSVNFP
jgi:hypothetical protein